METDGETPSLYLGEKKDGNMEIDYIMNNNNDDSGGGNGTSAETVVTVAEEEEARQAIEMLRSDDMSARVAAASKLENVAAALGEQRTREELLPFLTDGADDDDEVLIVIASSLGKMIPYVGGPKHAHTILPPLELLLTVEENTVRQNATESALQVSTILPAETFQRQYADMLHRLATKEWFTARISACALIATAFTKFTLAQQEIHLQHFASLCRDDVPMVRRIAAKNIGILLQNVVLATGNNCVAPDGMIATTLIPLYEELASTDQPDAIRLQTAENSISFGLAMSSLFQTTKTTKNNNNNNDSDNTNDDSNQPMDTTTPYDNNNNTENQLSLAGRDVLIKRILPLVEISCDDRSWRVRWTAASKFGHIIKAFTDFQGSMDTLIPSYEKLLQDPEAEVKIASILNMPHVSKCPHLVLPESPVNENETTIINNTDNKRVSIACRLVKKAILLSEDENENVRAAIAMVVTEMAPILGKDLTISQLVPSVLLLLQDITSEVRLNIISTLSSLDEVIGIELLAQSLLPAIINLAEDGKWRIRLAIIEKIPLLAKQLGKEFFSNKLTGLCLTWLGDNIASIRHAAAINLQKLVELFGSEWTSQYLMPSLLEIQKHQSYLRRLVAVETFALMAAVLDQDYAKVELLPLILDMASDSVPNIRFNVAKWLETLAPLCGKNVCDSQIRPVLVNLTEDPDRDVRFYANKTLESLDNNGESPTM